jgi:chorismate mutase/prephenate dehydratase
MKDSESQKILERLIQLDRELTEQINQRARMTAALADQPNASASLGQPGDQALLKSVKKLNHGPLSDAALICVLREIEGACNQVQGIRRIAFLGPEASFCHLAAQSHFGKSVDYAAQGSVADVFHEVERGKAVFGVAPVENTVEGSVVATLDTLTQSSLEIMGEVLMQVSYCLVSRETKLGRVRRVISHAGALEKCARWLGRNLPIAVREETSSSAAAAALAANEPGMAALASRAAAELHGLTVLAEDVQEMRDNITRYLIIGPHRFPETGNDKTSILFVTRHHPGALADALSILAKHGVNLSRIESRPTREAAWEYQFFADLDGHVNDEPLSNALAELAGETSHLKVLGSYAKG